MAAEPASFDAVFSHALAMQELATRATEQPAEALRLLTEVPKALCYVSCPKPHVLHPELATRAS